MREVDLSDRHPDSSNPRRRGRPKKDGGAPEFDYAAWYRDNNGDISERRRDRYAVNEKHRERILKQNKACRKKIAKPKKKKKYAKMRRPVKVAVELNGVNTELILFHVGTFAPMVGKSVSSIHQWERAGLLPKTPYVMRSKSKEERLYSKEMADVVKKSLKKRGPFLSYSDPTFRGEIESGWLGLGISNEEIICKQRK